MIRTVNVRKFNVKLSENFALEHVLNAITLGLGTKRTIVDIFTESAGSTNAIHQNLEVSGRKRRFESRTDLFVASAKIVIDESLEFVICKADKS